MHIQLILQPFTINSYLIFMMVLMQGQIQQPPPTQYQVQGFSNQPQGISLSLQPPSHTITLPSQSQLNKSAAPFKPPPQSNMNATPSQLKSSSHGSAGQIDAFGGTTGMSGLGSVSMTPTTTTTVTVGRAPAPLLQQTSFDGTLGGVIQMQPQPISLKEQQQQPSSHQALPVKTSHQQKISHTGPQNNSQFQQTSIIGAQIQGESTSINCNKTSNSVDVKKVCPYYGNILGFTFKNVIAQHSLSETSEHDLLCT